MMRYAGKDFGGVDILVNNAGIQFVAKIENSRSTLGRDHRHQPDLRLPHHPPGLPVDEGEELGPHHQRGLDPPGGIGGEIGLRGQARHRRLHQGHRAGNRADRRHRQRHLPGLGADAAGAESRWKPAPEGRHSGRTGQARAAAREAAFGPVRHARGTGRAGRVPVERSRQQVRGAIWNMDGGWVAQ
jgi:hypothetical protein